MFEKLKKVLTPVESMSADEARDFMQASGEGSYTLLDVRQPGEYENSHIPGSTLVPLPQLTDRVNELDPDKPVVVY